MQELNRAALGQRILPTVELVDEHVFASRVVAEGLDKVTTRQQSGQTSQWFASLHVMKER